MRAKEFSELDEENILAIMDMLVGWSKDQLLPEEDFE
jgi:hypothetical protein